MPSGSHGGGSHGSHGGSHGGSHFSGSHGGSSRPPRPMRVHFFGHHYYVPASESEKVRSNISLALFLSLFVIVFAFVIPTLFKEIETIKNDRDYYIAMIEYAESNPSFVKQGKVTGIYYNEDVSGYYFEYQITCSDGISILNGYTYSVYNETTIGEFYIGKVLDFAVDSSQVTLATDSINMGYKDLPLSADAEYENNRTGIFILIPLATGFVVAIIALITKSLITVKKHKGNGEEVNNTEKGTSVNTESVESETKEGSIVCRYCGNVISNSNTHCPNCGADTRY